MVFASILDHAYLLSEHYSLHFGQASGSSLCNISDLFSCAAVSASRYSRFLGVPMALWGMAANSVLLLLIVWHPLSDASKQPASRRNILLVAGVIAITSLVMAGISMLLLSRFCPFCMVAYLLSFLSLGFLWVSLPKYQDRNLLDQPIKISDFTPLLVLGGLAFVFSFIADDQITNSYGARDLGPVVRESVQSWQANPSLSFTPVEPLVLGAAVDKTKMTIVEFADFRCSHCRHAAPVLKAFVDSHPDVRLEFEVWPLDGECNSAIPTRNGASCLLARAVYCAQKLTGHGWKAHEYVYENQEQFASVDSVRGALPGIAQAAGAESPALISCADSADTKAVIEKEAAVGTGLNLEGTPSVFVNGKKLPAGQIMAVLSATYDAIQGH